MHDKAFSEDPFVLKYCLDREKTQDVCDKVVNDISSILNFVTNEILKNVYNALFADDDIHLFDEGTGNDAFSSDENGIPKVDLDNIKLDDPIFYEDGSKTINHIRLLTWHNSKIDRNNVKHSKQKKNKSKQKNTCSTTSMPEDEKIET